MPSINGYARLGKTPELKYIGEGEDKQPVCELSVKFINAKKKKGTGSGSGGEGEGDDYDDLGFWAQVNVWGNEAEPVSRLLSKGDKVYISDGKLAEKSWPDKDNAEITKSSLQVDCRLLFPVLSNIENLTYKARSSNTQSE